MGCKSRYNKPQCCCIQLRSLDIFLPLLVAPAALLLVAPALLPVAPVLFLVAFALLPPLQLPLLPTGHLDTHPVPVLAQVKSNPGCYLRS